MPLLSVLKKIFNIRNSIFIKITLVIFTAVIMINMVILLFFGLHMRYSRGEQFSKSLEVISEYIIKEIGIPPDYEKARSISARSGFDIIIMGPEGKWSSSKNLKGINKKHVVYKKQDITITLFRGTFSVEVRKGTYTFILITNETISAEELEMFVLILILIITIMMSGVYFFIKYQLRPVKYLIHGIEKISAGNMSYSVPVSSIDELGTLTNSFNKMNIKIRDMIKLKEQLLIDVSHEMRSPLTRMKIALEFVPDVPARSSIKEDIGVLDSMLTEILEAQKNFNTPLNLVSEKTLVSDLINSSLKLLRTKDGQVTVKFSDDDIFINVDRDKANIALKNIIENSIKYSVSPDTPIEIIVEHDNLSAKIKVTDRGIGIPANEIPFIFEPFYRTDHSRSRETGGFGLGLSIVKRIMNEHGGSVEIASGSGTTTAILKFPLK